MNTSLLLCLVGGIAIGWLAEYLLDLRFWRQSNKRLQADYENLQHRYESFRADKSTLHMHSSEAIETISRHEKEIKNLKTLSRLLSAQLKQARAERDLAVEQAKKVHTELAQYQSSYQVDDLFEPTIFEFQSGSVSERLSGAGVKTFDALESLSDQELYEIVSSEQKRLAKGQGAWRPTSA